MDREMIIAQIRAFSPPASHVAAHSRQHNRRASSQPSVGETASAEGAHERAKQEHQKQLSVDDYVDQIPAPLVPVVKAGKYVHDLSTIMLRCPLGHVEPHYLQDLALAKCRTCNSGTKFSRAARTTVERVLGAPLVYVAGNRGGDPIAEYSNPYLGLHIVCCRASGVDGVAPHVDGTIVVTVGKPRAQENLKKNIYTLLLHPLLGSVLSAAQVARLCARTGCESTLVRCRIPYTRALAKVFKCCSSVPLLEQDLLCFESCAAPSSLCGDTLV